MRLLDKSPGTFFAPCVHRKFQLEYIQFIMGQLEHRVMRSDSVAQATVHQFEISQLSGFALFADIIVGDNGSEWGVPTLAVGSSWEDFSVAYQGWDENLEDGFDSGLRTVELTADFSEENISWSVEEGASAQFGGGSCDEVSSVIVRAGVQGPGMKVQWSNVLVKFYRDEELAATSSVGLLEVDTTGESTAAPEERRITFTPSGTGYDKVVVSGEVRLQADEEVYVWANDLFGQVLINC